MKPIQKLIGEFGNCTLRSDIMKYLHWRWNGTAQGGGGGHHQLSTSFFPCNQTCAKVPKRFGIQGSLSPRSGILMDLGPLCCHFCRKTLETQDPKIWILREAQGT